MAHLPQVKRLSIPKYQAAARPSRIVKVAVISAAVAAV